MGEISLLWVFEWQGIQNLKTLSAGNVLNRRERVAGGVAGMGGREGGLYYRNICSHDASVSVGVCEGVKEGGVKAFIIPVHQ